MPLEEFAKLTPEEKAAYKRQGDEMSRKTKEGYDKAKERPFKKGGMTDLTGDGKITRADVLKGRGVFKRGGKVKGYAPGGTVKEDEKQRRRSEGAPVRYTPPRRRKPSDPAISRPSKRKPFGPAKSRPPKSISNLFKETLKNVTTKGGKKTITPASKRYNEEKKKRKGMNCGGTVIMDRNYLKGK